MKSVKLCGECAKKFKPKGDVRMIKVIGQKNCLFNQPFITNEEVGKLIEVIA